MAKPAGPSLWPPSVGSGERQGPGAGVGRVLLVSWSVLVLQVRPGAHWVSLSCSFAAPPSRMSAAASSTRCPLLRTHSSASPAWGTASGAYPLRMLLAGWRVWRGPEEVRYGSASDLTSPCPQVLQPDPSLGNQLGFHGPGRGGRGRGGGAGGEVAGLRAAEGRRLCAPLNPIVILRFPV